MAGPLKGIAAFARFYLRQWYINGIALAMLVLMVVPTSVDARVFGITLALATSGTAAMIAFRRERRGRPEEGDDAASSASPAPDTCDPHTQYDAPGPNSSDWPR